MHLLAVEKCFYLQDKLKLKSVKKQGNNDIKYLLQIGNI